jgi:hypothetical protein
MAQLEGGVLEQAVRGRDTESSIGGSIEGSAILAGGRASGDVRWTRSESETRTLHDYMFNHVETLLDAGGYLMEVGREGDKEATERLFAGEIADGFLRVAGSFTLRDFRFLASLLEDMFPLLRAAGTLDASGDQKKAEKRVAEWTHGVKEKQLKDLASVLRATRGEEMMLQVRPNTAPASCLETNLDDSWIRFARETLRIRYGSRLQGGWTLVARVGPPPVPAKADPPLLGQEGFAALIDALEHQFASTMAQFLQISPPIVPVVPIALYREV